MKTRKTIKKVLIHCVVLLLVSVLSLVVKAQDTNSANQGETANANNTTRTQKQESTKITDNFKFVFEIGGQFRDLNGERPSKLEEFGRIREGFIFRRFRITSNPADSPNFFRAIGRSPTEIDQQYLLDFGRYGTFRTTFEWSGAPHLYSRGSRTLFGGNNGIITIPDGIQQTLQNTPDATVPSVVQNIYANTPTITLQVKRETFSFRQTAQVSDYWSFRFNWLRYKRFGTRPLGTGSYERIGTATGDTFRVHSIELPEQLDYISDQVTFGASYVRKKWGVNFDYTYSIFENEIPSLTFDNPFRITDLQATGSGGVFDRQKFARGIIALPPGNHGHNIFISAFVDLPRNTRLAAALGWSFWRQDEQFVPYTLNTAVVTGVPAGLNITSTDSLPVSNLDGEVNVFTQDYVIASRPWKNWTFNLKYRRYAHDNETHEILFPGYVAFGESWWRSNISGVPIENEPPSFFKTNTSAEAIWDISKTFKWKVEYEWEGWVRRHRQAGRTNEHSISTQFTYKPTARFTGKLNYKYSDRTPLRYNAGVKEFSQLRMFDQAQRLRHDVDVQWQWSVRPQVGLSGTFGYLSDDYDQNFFGLVRNKQWYGSFDLLYMPKDNMTFYANYSRENYKNSLQTVAKTAAPYALENRWNRDEKDVLDNFGVGVTSYLMKEKMLVDLNYVFSNGRTQTTTVNPATPLANSVLNATAFPFPDVKTRFQEFNSDVSYQFANNWGLGVRYIYQPYRLDDFAWNGLTPYPITALTAEQTGTRFLLLDSRYSGHNAHVVSVYFRFNR